MTKNKNEKLPKELINIALVLVLGAIAPMLDTTMVNIAVNKFGTDFHTSLDVIQWVITGYVLATGIAVPFSGWLINRFDGKHIYLAAEFLFLVSSILSGISWNIDSLIIFRIIQGFSAGLIIPLLTTLLVQTAGQENMGKLMSIVGLPIILGPILGPVIGGGIVEYTSWRWIFFINIPIGLIALFFIYKKLPNFAASNKGAKLDWLGVILLGGLSASYIYGITQAASGSGFTNSKTIGFILLGLLLTIVYVIYALLKSKKVILPLSLFKYKSFTASIVALFLAGIGTNGPMLLLPLFFQNIRHDSVILAGLSLIPQGLGMLVARPMIGKLTDKIGAKLVVVVAIVITLIGTVPFLWFSQSADYWLIGAVLFIRGIGVGGITIPVMTDSYTGLSRSQIPQASIATRIIQNIGGAFGSALLATVVANQMMNVAPNLTHLTSAYQTAFLVANILTVVMFIPALFLTNKAKRKAKG
ncbi:MDR family MFS transporter [Pullulanibacillus sp. KACC 23026]|uniref:MDR family MFS transporter n=1 Tax=Pullulanibacillus sp. KACC 23026 TaxID=3028315 RepID=UPI0023B02386|nr:MDR family MFS transporter [Pullulanibacillus sp. KACC 23026]WEG11087.1 MDR family MFS transporter [Pullulanibacillus sp. KACC 23026]